MTIERKTADEYAEIRSEFALWLALPKHERNPKDQNGFAAQHGIRPATLSDWKALPEFSENVTKNALSVAATYLGRVLHAIAGHAMKGDDDNARLFLETLGLVRTPGSAGTNVIIGAGGLDGIEREEALAERDAILARRGGLSHEGNGDGSRSS